MEKREFGTILLSICALTIIIFFKDALASNFGKIGLALIAATLIIAVNIFAKLIMARSFGAVVEHEFLMWERFGFKPGSKISRPIPGGIILSLIITLFTAGIVKWSTLLSYETTAHKGSTRKIAGYVFTEMTDWHTAMIGAAGIIATLTLSFVTYWIPSLHLIAQAAAYYAFFNMIPFSKIDGAQIFSGSQVLWTALAIISTLFAMIGLLVI